MAGKKKLAVPTEGEPAIRVRALARGYGDDQAIHNEGEVFTMPLRVMRPLKPLEKTREINGTELDEFEYEGQRYELPSWVEEAPRKAKGDIEVPAGHKTSHRRDDVVSDTDVI